MAQGAKEALHESLRAMFDYSDKAVLSVEEKEQLLDEMEDQLSTFLLELSAVSLTDEDSRTVRISQPQDHTGGVQILPHQINGLGRHLFHGQRHRHSIGAAPHRMERSIVQDGQGVTGLVFGKISTLLISPAAKGKALQYRHLFMDGQAVPIQYRPAFRCAGARSRVKRLTRKVNLALGDQPVLFAAQISTS